MIFDLQFILLNTDLSSVFISFCWLHKIIQIYIYSLSLALSRYLVLTLFNVLEYGGKNEDRFFFQSLKIGFWFVSHRGILLNIIDFFLLMIWSCKLTY